MNDMSKSICSSWGVYFDNQKNHKIKHSSKHALFWSMWANFNKWDIIKNHKCYSAPYKAVIRLYWILHHTLKWMDVQWYTKKTYNHTTKQPCNYHTNMCYFGKHGTNQIYVGFFSCRSINLISLDALKKKSWNHDHANT